MACRAGAFVLSVASLWGCTNDYDLLGGDTATGAGATGASSSGSGGAATTGPGGAGGAGAAGGTPSTSSAGGAGAQGGGGSGGAAPCKLAALVDDFNGNTIDPVIWTKTESNRGVAELQGGNLELHPSGNGYSRAEIQSVELFDLHGCSMHVRTAQALPANLPVAHYLKARLDPQDTWLRIGVNGDYIRFEIRQDGIVMPGEMATIFDPDAHAWWRIREDDGLVYLETSPDKQSWTAHLQARTPPFVGAIRANLGSSSYWDSTMDPGEARFDDFNQ
jgi:hypothetical protein